MQLNQSTGHRRAIKLNMDKKVTYRQRGFCHPDPKRRGLL